MRKAWTILFTCAIIFQFSVLIYTSYRDLTEVRTMLVYHKVPSYHDALMFQADKVIADCKYPDELSDLPKMRAWAKRYETLSCRERIEVWQKDVAVYNNWMLERSNVWHNFSSWTEHSQ